MLEDDVMLSGVSFIGAAFVFICALTGAAIWMRWGWTGIKVIWSKRDEIDNIVKQDLQETVFRG